MNLHQFRQILVITLLLPLVLLLLLALVLAWQIQRTLREQRRIDHTDRITAQLNEMERLVVDQETGLRGYQLTRDPTTLEPYQNAEGSLHLAFDSLLLLVREDPDQLRRLRQVRDSHELWMGFAGRALDNLRAGKIFGDTALDLNGAQLMAALRTQIGAMTQVEVKRRADSDYVQGQEREVEAPTEIQQAEVQRGGSQRDANRQREQHVDACVRQEAYFNERKSEQWYSQQRQRLPGEPRSNCIQLDPRFTAA